MNTHQRSLVVCKPDCLERGVVDDVRRAIIAHELNIIESVNVRLNSAEVLLIGPNPNRVSEGVYKIFVDYMTRGDCVVFVVEGPDVHTRTHDVRTRIRVSNGLPARWNGGSVENLVHVPDADDVERAFLAMEPYLSKG